jgi:hypothetical protein
MKLNAMSEEGVDEGGHAMSLAPRHTSPELSAKHTRQPQPIMPTPEVADAPSAQSASSDVVLTPSTRPEAVTSKRQPPLEPKESLWLRRAVILSFWLVVVFLGLPVWWKTTAIYRAELPLQTMTDWADGKVGGSISYGQLLPNSIISDL